MLSLGTATKAHPQFTRSEQAEFTQYFNIQPGLAVSFEQRGDAAGNPAEALNDYVTALEYLAYQPYYMLHLDKAKRVKQGVRLVGLVPSDSIYVAGARDGDIVIAIDGKSVARMQRIQVSELMLDEARQLQTPAFGFKNSTFTLLRGNTTLDVTPAFPEFGVGIAEVDRQTMYRLLGKQIAIYSARPERPAVPQAARIAAANAAALARSATDSDTIKKADAEFQKAMLIAPWWADLYINYALFQKASGDAVGAKRSLTYLLQLAPGSGDAPAARKMLADLDPDAAAQARLDDWTGWWAVSVNGVRQNTGMTVERKGTLLFVRNGPNLQPWLRATIVDDNHAKDIQRYSTDTGMNLSGTLGEAIRKCFSGALENSGTMTLSPDRKQLTAVNPGVPYINTATCAMTNTVPETMTWVR